jgi:hypothetical protein
MPSDIAERRAMLENLDPLCELVAAIGIKKEYSPVYLSQGNKIECDK